MLPPPPKLQVLRNRNYRIYWLGQLVSQTGTWMQVVAEGWLVLKLTGSIAALGGLNFAFAIPSLLLTPVAGALADRRDRRRIALVTQIALMLLALTVAGLIVADMLRVWVLMAAAALGGAAMAFDMPARTALVPELVEPHEIPNAMALNQAAFNGSRLIGPALAAVALDRLGLASAYVFNGLSFLAAIASLLLIRRASRPARARAAPMRESIREGLAYVQGSRLLRSLLLAMALVVLLAFPALAVLSPGYVRDVLHEGASEVGVLMATSGGTSLLGSLALLAVPARRRGHVMIAGVFALGLALSTLVMARAVWLAAIGVGALSLGFTVVMGLSMITIQQTVPDALRGRVMSVAGLTFSGVMPFAGLGVSFAVGRLGFGPVYTISAALCVVGGLAILLPSGIIGYDPRAETPQ